MTTRDDPTRPEAGSRHRKKAFLAAAHRFASGRVGPRRSGAVTAAAGFLGVCGLVFLLAGLLSTENGTADRVTTAVVLGGPGLAAAAALLWGRQRGYWVGLTVAALGALAAAIGVVVAGPVVGIILVLALIPLSLLLVRRALVAAWRRRWTAWRQVWGTFTGLIVVGGVFALVGAWMIVAGEASGIVVLVFGVAAATTSPLYHPRQLPPWLYRVSPVVGAVAMGLTSLALVVIGVDDTVLAPRPAQVVVGVIGFVFFGGGAVVLIVRGPRR